MKSLAEVMNEKTSFCLEGKLISAQVDGAKCPTCGSDQGVYKAELVHVWGSEKLHGALTACRACSLVAVIAWLDKEEVKL